jgi:catechol-2,3-dioxygenase
VTTRALRTSSSTSATASVDPERWQELVQRLTDAGVQHEVHSGVSVYFRDPDGARIELIADPLGEMYGHQVL